MPSARTESSWLVFRPRSDRMVGATWQGIVARPESGRRCLLRHARLGPRRSRQSPGQGTQVIEIVRIEALVRVDEADPAHSVSAHKAGIARKKPLTAHPLGLARQIRGVSRRIKHRNRFFVHVIWSRVQTRTAITPCGARSTGRSESTSASRSILAATQFVRGSSRRSTDRFVAGVDTRARLERWEVGRGRLL